MKKNKSFYLSEIKSVIEVQNNPKSHYTKSDISVKEWITEWDFKKSKIDIYTHQIHKYPAMFIPQMIRKLLNEYSEEGDLVLDIFNGSGTTSVECLLMNRNSIGFELNPLANLIGNVKTTPIEKDKLINSYTKLVNNYDSKREKRPHSFNGIEIWFSKSSIKYLSHLLDCIQLEKVRY